jgi:hypothetical protein
MPQSVPQRLTDVHPQMLRSTLVADPQRLGEDDRRRGIGQCFAAALERSGITKQQASGLMGYSDQGVIGRWISGQERVQIDKCLLLGAEFVFEFAAAIVEKDPHVVVEKSLRRTA